jgi:hypothetical protein
VDFFVKKWVESAEACTSKEGVEKEECYKTAADWHHHHGAESDGAQPAAESATASMAEDASAPALKLVRLKRFFSKMYQTLAFLSQKFVDLLKDVFG